MSDPYFQTLFAERIGGAAYGKGTDIYKFEKIKRAKRKAKEKNPERTLLDFGIGENDAMAAPEVREAMAREINCPENRGYADNGISEFKEAAARFMSRSLGVELDAETQINHSIGSKPALAMLPAAFINPGDVTLMTVPGYPVAATHTKYYGGCVYTLPLVAEHDFFPNLDAIPDDILKAAKILVLNYPNSPTGKTATRAFYEKVVDFCHQHQIVVIQDAAHIMLSFDSSPLSFLSVDGAMDVGVESHSLSKGFDMIGWRMGWVCGNERIVSAFSDIKDNTDSGQFIAIQKAAVEALENDEIPRAVAKKYRRRLEKLVAMLTRCGIPASMPGGTYFLYTPSPKGVAGEMTFESAEAASQYLITEHSICTVPWDDAGPYLRFSVTYEAENEQQEDELMSETEARLKSISFEF
ncbi:MAG: LL-diaminopimelate aminotransferase [Planctomycetota bacterium]|nr:LL-diaminopimelate aminotransferase [Planctomycetota bacterium]